MFKEQYAELCRKGYKLIETGMRPTDILIKAQREGISRSEMRRVLWSLAGEGKIRLEHDFTITKVEA